MFIYVESIDLVNFFIINRVEIIKKEVEGFGIVEINVVKVVLYFR